MKQTINKTQFVNTFGDMGRENNFSREGREMLFDWLEDYEEITGEEVEFDPIALCCEFSEDHLETLNREYGLEAEDLEEAADLLNEQTIVVGQTDETIIYQVF